MPYSTLRKFTFASFMVGSVALSGNAQQQQQTPSSHSLKVGARNSTIRNIGSFQADSALIFPKRLASDTTNSKSLKKKGAFFYDSTTHILWFF